MRYERFPTEEQAVITWADQHRPKSEYFEVAAFLYSVSNGDKRVFLLGRTYKGMGKTGLLQPNVILPFLYLYLVEATLFWLQEGAQIEAFLHTHPNPAPGFTYGRPSKIDHRLLFLPMIKCVYIIPYENNHIERLPPLE